MHSTQNSPADSLGRIADQGIPTAPLRIPPTATALIDSDIIRAAQRGGALYEEMFQILGPGVTPRELAGGTWNARTPPRHCEALCSIMRAVRNGDPLPPPPAEGWARDDLMHAQKGLWD